MVDIVRALGQLLEHIGRKNVFHGPACVLCKNHEFSQVKTPLYPPSQSRMILTDVADQNWSHVYDLTVADSEPILTVGGIEKPSRWIIGTSKLDFHYKVSILRHGYVHIDCLGKVDTAENQFLISGPQSSIIKRLQKPPPHRILDVLDRETVLFIRGPLPELETLYFLQ